MAWHAFFSNCCYSLFPAPTFCFVRSPLLFFFSSGARAKLGAKRLRTFHEAAGIATGGSLESRRPPMRLSYYGGGHYDSVSPIDEPYSGNPPVGEEGVGRGRRGGGSFGPASGVAEPVREPGQLEDEALERSRRRAAEASSGRCVCLCVQIG